MMMQRQKQNANNPSLSSSSSFPDHNNDNDNDNDNNAAISNDTDDGGGGIWIGIDFGTSNCTVAVWDSNRGRPKSCRLKNIAFCGDNNNNNNNTKIGRLVPSLVDKNDNVGAMTILQNDDTNNNNNNKNVISSFKRLIGYNYTKESDKDGDPFLESLPYKVIFPSSKSEDSKIQIQIQFPNNNTTTTTTTTTLDHIVTTLLKEIRISSHNYLNSREVKHKNMILPGGSSNADDEIEIRNVVIGVPANFSKKSCNFIIDCANHAGFFHVRTFLESTAAAMSYGLTLQQLDDDDNDDSAMSSSSSSSNNNSSTIMVIDMGGGTTDITIATKNNITTTDEDEAEASTSASYKVLVTHGNSQLGGDDIDYDIMEYCYNNIKQEQQQQKHKSIKTNIKSDNPKLRLECRKAKERLCDIENPCIETQIKYYHTTTTSSSIDDDDVIVGKDDKQKKKDYDPSSSSSTSSKNDAILLVTLTNQEFELLLQPWLQRAKILIQQSLDKLLQSTEKYKVVNEIILVGGTTKIPAVRHMIQSIFPSVELCTSLNPMLSVGQGLAIQAAIVSRKVPIHQIKSAMMLDCIPHSIGVLLHQNNHNMNDNDNGQNNNNNYVEIIPRNALLPARGKATFTLANPNQPGVTIRAVEQIIVVDESNSSSSGSEYTYYYEPMSTEDFTFLLKRLPNHHHHQQQQRSIEVGMMVDKDGQFIVSIFDENDPEQVRKRNRLLLMNNNKKKNGGENDNINTTTTTTSYGELEYIVDLIRDESGMTNTEQFFLIATLVGVFVLYIAVKIAFAEPGRDGSTIL